MKIVYIVTRADVGGAQVHIRDLCQALLSRGEEVTVLVGGNGLYLAELERAGIPYRVIPHLVAPIRPSYDARALWEILAALRDIQPDLVHCHTSKAGFLGRLACAPLRLPCIFTPHGWTITDRVSSGHGRIFRVLEKFAALFTTRIVNVCQYEVDLALGYRVAPARKLALVYNGMHDVGDTLRADATRQPPRLLMVARMEPQKDHATLLDALAGLAGQPWELELIGDGPLEGEIRAQAARLGIAGRVRFSGFSDAVAEHLAEAQALVLASRFEAFPYSILEGMRAGLPVVATDVGGVSEAVVDEATGFLVPRGDVAALRSRLATVIADPLLRQRMGEAGRRKFLAQFTFENMLAKTIRLYGEAVAEGMGVRSRAPEIAQSGD